MRICILSQSRPEIVGGVESYMKSLSLWLSSHQQDVVLISRGLFKIKTSLTQSIQDSDNRILRVPQPIYLVGLLISSFVAALKVLHENRKKRIDIIHAVDSGYAGLAGVLASRIIGAPLCYSVHSHRRSLLGGYLISPLGWLMLSFDSVIERLVYLKANKIIVVGTSLKTYVLSFRIPFKKIAEVPVAIQVRSFGEFKPIESKYTSLGLDESKLVIGYVGRLEREKNLPTLLRAFGEIVKAKEDVYLLLIGAGSLESSLRDYVGTISISENVRFLGPQRNISSWLRVFDIFVLPSYTEGTSIALLEAMAAEKAIIASDIPGIRGLMQNGKEGLLFNPYDHEQLKTAISVLCHDPQLRKSLGESAKRKAMKYDVKLIFPMILETYGEILKDAQRKSKD